MGVVLKRGWVATGLLIVGLSLVACGESATNTPGPTATPAATKVINPIIATISAGPIAGTPVVRATPIPATLTVATNTAPLPLYSGLKPLNLGVIGQQITNSISQASNGARSNSYVTADSFDKLASFYNQEMTGRGYTKAAQEALPASVGLNGNVLLYTKGSGTAAEVVAILDLGPLDATLASTLAQAASDTTTLKDGDSIVIVLSGLNGTNLLEFQKTLGGNVTPAAPVASPTK